MDRPGERVSRENGSRFFCLVEAGDLGYTSGMLIKPDHEPSWVPRADIFVNAAGDLIIKVELAAMRRGDLELTVDGQRLRIAGQRPDADRAAAGGKYLVTEIGFGPFTLLVDVPPNFDLDAAKAKYSNGLLRVVVPGRRYG